MFWATASLSILLLGASGAMIDVLVRDPRGRANRSSADRSNRFARLRRVRRLMASLLVGLIGILLALWPVIPRQPKWVLAYTGLLTLAALGLLAMGVWDALATGRQYRKLSRKRAAKGHDELVTLVEQHRRKKELSESHAE